MLTAETQTITLEGNSTSRKTKLTGNPLLLFFGRFEIVLLATLLTVPLLFNVAFINPGGMLSDTDIWWHLADARYLLSQGFIHIEPYSFSVAGKSWVNPEWLAELPFWFGFKIFGLRGILFATIALVEANLLAVYLLARQRCGHAWTSFCVAVLGFFLMTVNTGPRTILVGYLCLAAEVAIMSKADRGSKRVLWLLPALFATWVNAHGSWAIGGFLYVLYSASRMVPIRMGVIQSERASAKERKVLIAVGILSMAALFANPYGWHLVWNPFDMIFYQKLNIASALEWRPLVLSSFRGIIVTVILLLIVAANAWRRRAWTLYEACAVAFGFFAAVDHVRFCFLLTVLVAPGLAFELRRTLMAGKDQDSHRPLLHGIFAALALLLGIHRVPTAEQYQAAYNRVFPVRLVQEIQPDWRVFNEYSLGGFLAFHHRPEMIDSRMDTFDKHKVLEAYLQAIHVEDTLAILRKYRIDHILFQRKSPLVYLLLHGGRWRVIGQQDGYVLLASPRNIKGKA